MQATRANHEVWQLLRDGFNANVSGPEGTATTEHLRYVLWTSSGSNEFLAVNQFWVAGPLHTRRADIVLFVNGIPLVLLELKASHRRVEDGYHENVRDYRHAIPQLFWADGFVLVSNGSEARVGATFASRPSWTR